MEEKEDKLFSVLYFPQTKDKNTKAKLEKTFIQKEEDLKGFIDFEIERKPQTEDEVVKWPVYMNNLLKKNYSVQPTISKANPNNHHSNFNHFQIDNHNNHNNHNHIDQRKINSPPINNINNVIINNNNVIFNQNNIVSNPKNYNIITQRSNSDEKKSEINLPPPNSISPFRSLSSPSSSPFQISLAHIPFEYHPYIINNNQNNNLNNLTNNINMNNKTIDSNINVNNNFEIREHFNCQNIKINNNTNNDNNDNNDEINKNRVRHIENKQISTYCNNNTHDNLGKSENIDDLKLQHTHKVDIASDLKFRELYFNVDKKNVYLNDNNDDNHKNNNDNNNNNNNNHTNNYNDISSKRNEENKASKTDHSKMGLDYLLN